MYYYSYISSYKALCFQLAIIQSKVHIKGISFKNTFRQHKKTLVRKNNVAQAKC